MSPGTDHLMTDGHI